MKAPPVDEVGGDDEKDPARVFALQWIPSLPCLFPLLVERRSILRNYLPPSGLNDQENSIQYILLHLIVRIILFFADIFLLLPRTGSSAQSGIFTRLVCHYICIIAARRISNPI